MKIVFLEVSKGSAINPKTKDVDMHSRKILTPSLRSWNQSSNIINILNEIRNCFSKVFPIYKIKKNQVNDGLDIRPTLNTINYNDNNNNRNDPFQKINNININNNAIFNFVSNNNINNNKINNNTAPNNDPFANIASIFTENFLNNQNNTGINITYNNNTIQNMNNNNILNLTMQNNQNMNKNINSNNFMNTFNISQMSMKDNNNIKNILIETVFDKISSKLIGEYKKLNQQNKTLNNYKNQYKNENNKMEKYISKKQDITSKCTKDLYHLNDQIKKLLMCTLKERAKMLSILSF